MANFEGTIREFTRFIGPYARIKVMHIAAKHKKNTGKCEDCGTVTKLLDAAHVKGKERPVLISNILSQFIDNDLIKIDLQEFEEQFVEAHLPIESTIRILCKSCHRIYDAKLEGMESTIKSETGTIITTSKKYEVSESMVIEDLIKEKMMNKSKALELINLNSSTKIEHHNTIFSNINATKNVWWLEPRNDKFSSDVNIVLHDQENKTIFLFHLPAGSIGNPEKIFFQRNDERVNSSSKIYIPVSDTKFIDFKGFDFTAYLTGKFNYETAEF